MRPSKRQSAAGTEPCTPVVVPFPVPNSDVGLVMAVRAGHPDSLRVLCERHSSYLVRLAARILGPDPGRDAIAAEGVERAAEAIHQLEDPHALGTWLVWHVVAACRQRLKARRRWRWFAWQSRHRPILDGGAYSERLLASYRLLDRLRDESRIVFCLAVIDGMETADIVRSTGHSAVQVRALLQQACLAFVRLGNHEPSGADLAREQDAVLVGARLTELDLLRCARRAGTRASVSAPGRFPLTLSLLTIALTLTAFGIWKLPAVGCEVQGESKVVGEERFGQWVVAPASEPKVARFSDGSEVRLAKGSRMRLAKTSRWDTNVTLESGSVELEVTGKPFVDYRIGAGPFALALSKGRVQVSWDPMNELLDLVVEDGYVVISGCQFGVGRSVVAGKELGTRCMPRQPA